MVKRKEEKLFDFDDEEMRTAIAEMRLHLVDGMSDEQAREEMGISFAEFEVIKRALYDLDTAKLQGRSASDVFVDYRNSQLSCVRDLNHLLGRLETSKQFSASVGAIRAMSDIHDKILKTGQDLGVIAKRPKEVKHIHEGLGAMSEPELRKVVTAELRALKALVEGGGGGSIIDIDPGPIHRPAPKMRARLEDGGKRTKTRKGRRVVKEAVEAST